MTGRDFHQQELTYWRDRALAAEATELMDVWAQMGAVLLDASKQRDQRRTVVDTVDGPEMAWTMFERSEMLAEVNRVRVQRGHPPVGLAEITLVDNLASGHCDWFEKFSFYCAEVAFGLNPLRR